MTGTRGDIRFKLTCPACKRKRILTVDVWFDSRWIRISKCHACKLPAVAGPLDPPKRRVRWEPDADVRRPR